MVLTWRRASLEVTLAKVILGAAVSEKVALEAVSVKEALEAAEEVPKVHRERIIMLLQVLK